MPLKRTNRPRHTGPLQPLPQAPLPNEWPEVPLPPPQHGALPMIDENPLLEREELEFVDVNPPVAPAPVIIADRDEDEDDDDWEMFLNEDDPDDDDPPPPDPAPVAPPRDMIRGWALNEPQFIVAHQDVAAHAKPPKTHPTLEVGNKALSAITSERNGFDQGYSDAIHKCNRNPEGQFYGHKPHTEEEKTLRAMYHTGYTKGYEVGQKETLSAKYKAPNKYVNKLP